MTKTNMIRAAALAALVATPFVSVPAAGPFQVRRATTAQAVGTAPPVATVATSPYDGEPIVTGGVSYDYAVYDAAGTALDISVQPNPVTHTIRISFDDSNAASAPVDALQSSIAVAPASINADGVQAAVITVIPRDANGVLLGRGLSITIDASLLWPAQLSGPITDLGNGSYRALAVASVPGTGSVRVVVEGVDMAQRPTIDATVVDTSASLRDLAIAQLQSLAGPGGPMSALLAQAGAGTHQGHQIAQAISAANAAVASLENNNTGRDDNDVKSIFDDVVSNLENVLNAPGVLDPLDVRDTIDDLLGVARLLAEWHLEQATAACGTCDGNGNPNKVCDAMAAMEDADAMRAAVSPDWQGALDEYARVIALALQAVQAC
jgi:hypothetical protein